MNRSRNGRRDPQPLTRPGEAALVGVALALGVVGYAAVFGIAVSAAVFGGGWIWPADAGGGASLLAALLRGDPARALPPAEAARLAHPAATYVVVAIVELAVAVLAVAVIAHLPAWLTWSGDPRRGMASRSEAASLLGRRPLRRAARVVRPDRNVRRLPPTELGWRLGRSEQPRGVELWIRHDRTAGVYGAQGSGKTLDLLAPALLAHPGAGLVTLTKVDDLILTSGRRAGGGRPIAVLDPFGAAPGLPPLIWDPIAGCVDPQVAERRAKAFAAGTVTGAVTGGRADNAARFYAAETAKVLQSFFHAAALTGRTLEDVMEWVANPLASELPAEILRRHPQAAKFWDGLLAGALQGSPDTVGNTITTVQQAMALFFQPAIRERCVPGDGRPATDLDELLFAHGTVYLLGREDPYASASPLMTAVAEHILDVALAHAAASPHGRLTPSLLACLDELPSTAPLPTLRVRMANERALGVTFIYAAQTWRQIVVCYGEDEARSLFGLTNTIIAFGSGKDVQFYRQLSDLIGTTRVSRQTISDGPGGVGSSRAGEDVPVLRPEHLRLLPQRRALVIAENAPPVLAKLTRCIDGRAGRLILADQSAARRQLRSCREGSPNPASRTEAAVDYSQAHRLTPGKTVRPQGGRSSS